MTDTTLNVQQSVNQSAMTLNLFQSGVYHYDSTRQPYNRMCFSIQCTGLKPNTIVHLFFDKVLVDAWTRQLLPNSSGLSFNDWSASYASGFGNAGAGFMTNGFGGLALFLFLPDGMFFTNSRLVEVADVADIVNNASNITTYSAAYAATRYMNQFATEIITTRAPEKPIGFSVDPFVSLAQTFYVGSDDTFNKDGLSITAIDLFFKTKDSTKGVNIELVTVQDDVPTTESLPLSRVYKTSAEVSTTGATKFTFSAPVYLRAGYSYAINIKPDGMSPDYTIYTAVTGDKNTTDSITVIRNWGEGKLFTSATSSANWTPVPNEYLKFNVYKAVYSTVNYTVSLTNDDLEFLKLANVSSGFYMGEHVFLDTANATGNIAFSTSASNVAGYGTSFSTTVAAGNKIVVSNGSAWDVLTVNSVANNTSLIVRGYPKLAANSLTGSYKNAVIGTVLLDDFKNFELTLNKSNAVNAAFCFTQSGFIRGVLSGATANIVDILDKEVHKFQPFIPTLANHGTDINFSSRATRADDNTDDSFRNQNINHTNHRHDRRVKAMSRTNEIKYRTGNKSLTANIIMSTDSSTISPVVDKQGAGLLVYTYKINNNSYGENKRNGLAAAKYI